MSAVTPASSLVGLRPRPPQDWWISSDLRLAELAGFFSSSGRFNLHNPVSGTDDDATE